MIKIDTAVVLAAGRGKRLNDNSLIKPLINVREKPLICHVIDNLLAVNIKNIYIIKRKEDCLENIKNLYAGQKIKIKFIDDCECLGSLYTLSLSKQIDFKWILCSDCDVICEKQNFIHMFKQGKNLVENGSVQSVIAEVIHPSINDSNMLMIKDGRAVRFVKEGVRKGKRGGYVYLFNKNILNECENLLNKGCYSMAIFLDYIMQKYSVGTMKVGDMWDVDTWDDVNFTNNSNLIL